MWAVFSLDTLIHKFTSLALNSAEHFVILAFSDEYFFHFLFRFLSYMLLSQGEKRQKTKTTLVLTGLEPRPCFPMLSFIV